MIFDKYDKMGAYHWMLYDVDHIYRQHVDLLISWIGKGSVLDFGCGDGLITSKLNAVGYDTNEKAIELAKEKGVNCSTILPDRKFDNILLADVIEHIENPVKELKVLNDLLEDSGVVYVVTPIKQPVLSKYHYREYEPDELINEMELLGFTVLQFMIESKCKRMYAMFAKCQ